jgi:hypothetical protein
MKMNYFLTISALGLLILTGCNRTNTSSTTQPETQPVIEQVATEEKPIVEKYEVLTSKQGQKALVATSEGKTDAVVYDEFKKTAVTNFGDDSIHEGYSFFADSSFGFENPTAKDKTTCFIAWSKPGTKLNDPGYRTFAPTGCKLEEFNLNLQKIMDKNKVEVVYFSQKGPTSGWGRFVLVQNIK